MVSEKKVLPVSFAGIASCFSSGTGFSCLSFRRLYFFRSSGKILLLDLDGVYPLLSVSPNFISWSLVLVAVVIRGLFEVGSVRWGSHTTGTHLHSRVGGRGTRERERERERVYQREKEKERGVC